MGVYIFQCKGTQWIKVGHFKPRWGKHHNQKIWLDNPWFRVERRGFNSIKHPKELSGSLNAQNLEILAWYPELGRRCEGQVHKRFSQGKIGEFHQIADLEHILHFCDALGTRVVLPEGAREAAQAWAGTAA